MSTLFPYPSGVVTPETETYLLLDSTQDFLFAAKRFIDLTEHPGKDAFAYCQQVRPLLTQLYAAGLHLQPIPKTDVEDADDIEDPDFHNIGILLSDLGINTYYWEAYNPLITAMEEPELGLGWLADDLQDIYEDLKRELHVIKQARTSAEVEMACRTLHLGFQGHWGNHCVNALRALHYLRRDK